MNIALIGSGGREHALCEKINESKLTENIICIPGNAGTAKIAKNIDVDFLNFKKLLQVLKHHKIHLVVVGPEEPLVKGMVDFLKKIKLRFLVPISLLQSWRGQKHL